jgi:hypothetical protein
MGWKTEQETYKGTLSSLLSTKELRFKTCPTAALPYSAFVPPTRPPPHQLPGPWEHAVEKDILLVGTLTVAQPLPSHSAVTLSSLTMNFLSQEPWRMHQM